jgi:hypothetical protein
MDYDPYEFFEEERDEDAERAKPYLEDLILQQRAATDRELKVRLERSFFPWVVSRALDSMERAGIISKMGYPGRTSKKWRVPGNFYVPCGTAYKDVADIIEKKRDASRYVNAILTAHAPAGYHAEILFEAAFRSLGFKIRGRESSDFRGKKVQGVEGKELPNLDFIIEKDDAVYGVDVKNWLKYERQTRFLVIAKVKLALQLEIIPFIIARYVDRDTMYKQIIEKNGLCYPYQMLLVPPSYGSLAREANALLGYPILAVDSLPIYKVKFLQKLHARWLEKNG